MKRFVHPKSPMDILEDVKGSWGYDDVYEYDDEDLDDNWEMLSRKDVHDWDGFLTDYTLWYNDLTGEYATFYGDREIYNPFRGDEPDMVFSNEDEAWDWFEDYSTDMDGADVE